jgi:putative membrane protein
MLKSSLVLAVALAAGAAVVSADVAPAAKRTKNSSSSTAAAAGYVAGPDSAFMAKAGGDGMAEVELGRMAVDRASSADVKAFAQMMVDDHTKANGELTGLAAQKGVTLPSEPPPAAKAAKDHLGSLSGAAFDKAYMTHMVADHEKAVALFSKEASGGKDSDTKEWAAKTLPTLQQHLARAREVAGGHGTGAGHSH